jgi:iron complex transport system substrate-binding protein
MKIFRLIFGFCLLFLLFSCTDSSIKKSKKNTIATKDYFERDFEMPIKVNRVIPLFYVQAEMICVIGASSKIVGIGKLFAIQSTIIHEYFPQLYKLPQVGIKSNVNYEMILALKPDIVFCGTERDVVDRLEQLKVNNLPTFPKNTLQVSKQILLYGKIFNKSDNALKIVNFLNKEYKLVVNRTKNLDSKKRPKIYYARTDLFTTLGSGINSEIINLIGGISVTKDLPNDMNGVKVSLENLYAWNPDIIIIRDRASITPDDIYKDERLKGINAVKNKKVFQETFSWTEFRIGMYFGIIEKAKWLHPELFQDVKPQSEYEQFVTLFKSFY